MLIFILYRDTPVIKASNTELSCFLLFSLFLLTFVSLVHSETFCRLQNHFEPAFMAQGDFLLGGIFPLHYNQEMPDLNSTYRPFDPRAFRWALTMILTVDEINQNKELLPNHTLGYKIFDSCAYPLTGQRAALAVLNGVTEEGHGVCSGASPLLISYFSSCACFTDRQKYPTFFRVIPNDDYQVKALAQLLVHFNWTWVGLIRGDHEYGRFAVQGLLRELQEIIQVGDKYFQSFKNSIDAKVVVVFSAEGEMTPFLRDYMEQNITGIQWVASEAWVTASVFSGSVYYPYLGGTIGFGIKTGYIPGLGDFIQRVTPYVYPSNPLMQELWEALYGCAPVSPSDSDLPLCSGDETLLEKHAAYMNTSSPRVAYNVYKAVYAVAHSLHNLFLCQPGAGEKLHNTVESTYTNCLFIIVSLDSIECRECPEDFWSNSDRTACIPKEVEFLAYDTVGIVLTVISVVGACLTIAVLVIFFYHRNTPIIRMNNSELSFFILLSLTLCFLCCLVFIGEPTAWSCMLRHTVFSITFSLCISCILGKTLVVLAAFTATRPGNNLMKWLGPKQQRAIIFISTLVQVVICVAWLIDAPPHPFRNMEYERSKIILECSNGSSLAFWCVLGYIGLQAGLCFLLAFLARNLPGNFNEAKVITFSILIFCAVWLAFIPAYISSPGNYADAVESFAILASSFGLLLCLFVPKCYIILLKPEKNTKQHLIGKDKK
uniref:G-protein coupled receptors family 3 profile domain-containing protein n=1 Tax=Periophthalmus magnuspinnatus TaxID=409849 RepID=A0A3B4AEK1_9GOBI